MGSPTARPPGMTDVATLAGVSHQTVSRVINSSGPVAPATRERVLQAIAQLGYRPNPSARALVTRQTSTIGVVAGDLDLYGPASTLIGIEAAAQEAGLWVSLAVLSHATEPDMAAALERFLSQGVDAIAVIAPTRASFAAVRAKMGAVPLAVVSAAPPAPGAPPLFRVDQWAGARSATAHLIQLGHRHISHVAGPSGWYEADARQGGWVEALGTAGLVPGPVAYGDWSARSGYLAAQELFTEYQAPPTAVFCANDHMALGLLKALAERGIRVPQDVAVVGFDDVPEAAYYPVALTTVRQDFAALGKACVGGLVAMLSTGAAGAGYQAPSPASATVATQLVVRQSSGG